LTNGFALNAPNKFGFSWLDNKSIFSVFSHGDSHLAKDLKNYNQATNDGTHICIWPTSPFISKPKCSSMVDFH
jgi:hypothetical protein